MKKAVKSKGLLELAMEGDDFIAGHMIGKGRIWSNPREQVCFRIPNWLYEEVDFLRIPLGLNKSEMYVVLTCLALMTAGKESVKERAKKEYQTFEKYLKVRKAILMSL